MRKKSLLAALYVSCVPTVTIAQLNLPPAPAGVQVTTQYGIEFSTVGNAGNRPFLRQDYVNNPAFWSGVFDGHGTVQSEFRISRTETTYGQWLPFVRAFAPYWTGSPGAWQLGLGLIYNPTTGYSMAPGHSPMIPIATSWPVAAAFCNWLQAGAPAVTSDSSVFFTGAYNFTGLDLANPGAWSHAIEASPNAVFRLPTMDEWYKAAYYDPNRFGPGQEGWWLFTDRRDREEVSGLPGVGESSIGLANNGSGLPVAAYPGSMSAFGLFDTSGLRTEWTTETEYGFFGPGARMLGTGVAADPHAHSDYIGETRPYFDFDFFGGFRVWAAVPTPGTGLFFVSVGIFSMKRRRS